MLRGLNIGRPIPVRPPSRIGISTSQDRLAAIHNLKRRVRGSSGEPLFTILPGQATRTGTPLGSVIQPHPSNGAIKGILARSGPGLNFSAHQFLVDHSRRVPLRTLIGNFGHRDVSLSGLARATANEDPGLPSGGGTDQNPIMLPGTEVTAKRPTNWLLIGGLALAAFVLFKGGK